MTIRPLILCGGSGTRLWPASRETFPKQFAPLVGPRSTFQETVLRVADPDLFGPPIVVAAGAHRFIVERQLSEIGATADLLLEPAPRDSAPAISAGAAFASETDPQALLLMLAADHVVRNADAFRRAVATAAPAAKAGRIVTFGIEPTFPATGYGYIEPGDGLDNFNDVRSVRRFVEKPDIHRARAYLAAGHLWNSGNFLFRADVLLDAYRRFSPDSYAAVRAALAASAVDLGARTLAAEHFSRAEKRSIDYAVMERVPNMAVVAGSFGWSDIGTWHALWDVAEKDDDGNVVRGPVDTIASRNVFVSSDGPAVGVIGLENTAVVATQDAVLVCDMARSGDVKVLVDRMRMDNLPQATRHARLYRPWGWRETTERGPRFHVRRVVVYPGHRMSLHRHDHRAEHWVVVRGVADVTVADAFRQLAADESVFVPRGEPHRLGNSSDIDVEIIEVATGDDLREDDIERLADDYRRG